MTNVSIKHLAVQLGGQQIISQLDLDVAAGEFLVLLGPSGCGKSTLLHSIAGLIDIHAGKIEIAGHDVSHAEPSERQIGMVFQSYALYPNMTVEKNMSFGLRISGLPKAEISRRIEKVAGMLQLDALLDRKPAQLSGGQRQRVAIGRALVREASVFLFDEPLSNLDAKLRTELRRELKLLHQNLAATMIYVTHDQVEAMTLATRIVVMRAGKIQQIGRPAEVYARPANLFVAGFLGAPAMNFIEGQLHAGSQFTSAALNVTCTGYQFDDASMSQSPVARRVVLGMRPEHLSIVENGAYEGVVNLVEPMGNHQVLWLKIAGQLLSCIAHGERQFRIDETVRFDIAMQQSLLFDADSGNRL